MTEAKREIVEPLEVVDEDERRPHDPQGAVCRLEHSQRIGRGPGFPSRSEDERFEAVSFPLHVPERPEQVRRRRQRHVPLGLVADHAKAIPQPCPLPGFGQQPALPGAWITDENSCGGPPACGCFDGVAESPKFFPPPDEEAHVPERTTKAVVATSRAPLRGNVSASSGAIYGSDRT